MPTDVHDLAEEPRALTLNRVGDAPEPRDAAGIVADHALSATDARRMNPDRLEDDEADPTPGLLGVIVDVPFARQVVITVVGGVGADEDAVSQLDRSDAERREDVGETTSYRHALAIS